MGSLNELELGASDKARGTEGDGEVDLFLFVSAFMSEVCIIVDPRSKLDRWQAYFSEYLVLETLK